MPDDGRALAEAPSMTHHRTTAERAVVLRSLPVFTGIDDEAVALLADAGIDCSFGAGERLLEEGAPTDRVHIVLDGKVTVSRRGRVTTEINRRGGVGFVTLLGDDPHGVTAVADEPTETLSFTAEVLREAYEESFPLLRNNLRLAASFILELRGDLPRPKGSDPEVELGAWRDEEYTLIERVLQVRRGFFSKVNLDAAFGVARATTEVRFEAGDVVWEVGDPSEFSCFIRYGRLRCENAAGDIVKVGADFALGTMDVIGAIPHRFSATCETDVIAFRLAREPWLAVLESHYELGMLMLRNFSNTMLAAQSGET